jgi:hypothetical protein
VGWSQAIKGLTWVRDVTRAPGAPANEPLECLWRWSGLVTSRSATDRDEQLRIVKRWRNRNHAAVPADRVEAPQEDRSCGALAPVNVPRWFVVRDRLSRVVEYHALLPHADLRAATRTECGRRRGGSSMYIPRTGSFLFCELENERVCVSIECFEAGSASSPGWPTTPGR